MNKLEGKKDISEEFESTKERVEQEIRDTDKNIAKLTKRKAELEQLLKNPGA
jgi:hypothetical protein